MAYSVLPGPLGLDILQPPPDAGTLWRGRSPLPGPVGLITVSGEDSVPAPSAAASAEPVPQQPAATPEGGKRSLTAGEVAMARKLFKDALDYTVVKVHNDEYLPFGLQPDDTAMAPNGEIYFNPAHFKEDFSQESNRSKRWFMHEMVHVWQYQLGYPVRLRGAIRIGLDYG